MLLITLIYVNFFFNPKIQDSKVVKIKQEVSFKTLKWLKITILSLDNYNM